MSEANSVVVAWWCNSM